MKIWVSGIYICSIFLQLCWKHIWMGAYTIQKSFRFIQVFYKEIRIAAPNNQNLMLSIAKEWKTQSPKLTPRKNWN